MKILQKRFSLSGGWKVYKNDITHTSACQLVIVFGNAELFGENTVYETLRPDFPSAHIVLSSTAGEIMGTEVCDHSLCITAIEFERTQIHTACTDIAGKEDSLAAGLRLGALLNQPELKSVLVLADGVHVNGSELAEGLYRSLPQGTVITGGLAGNGHHFEHTRVGVNAEPGTGRIAAIGFCSRSLQVFQSMGSGWDHFGHKRLISRSSKNVLYELDHRAALDTYRMYLGHYANELPAAGLLFPLGIGMDDTNLVRTLVAVNNQDGSVTMAGNVPQNHYARFMKTNPQKLVDAASGAAARIMEHHATPPELSIIVSCYGRRMVLDQRVEEEIEAVGRVVGNNTAIAGFYSYGEICCDSRSKIPDVHNQTIMITSLTENSTP